MSQSSSVSLRERAFMETDKPRPTVWMRATRAHTYEGKGVDVGQVYLAHADIVETIEILKFATREAPPPRAKKPPPFSRHDVAE